MRKLALFCFTVFLCINFSALSQDTKTIIKKNIFDPKRGEKESPKPADETEEADVKELPKDMPVLDGIIVINDFKKVILRYKDDESRKYISDSFFEGNTIADTTVKKITKNHVILVYNGSSYKVNIDSKYDSSSNGAVRPPSPSKPAASLQPKVVSRTIESTSTKPKTSRPVGKSSTPFGSPSKKTGTNDTSKRKKHPF